MHLIRKILVLAIALLASLSILTISVNQSVIAEDNKTQVCTGANLGGGSTCDDSGNVTKVTKLILNVLSWVVGVISVIMIMIGGFMYITSAGDATKAGKGKSTITYAIIGLIVAALAQTIARFVVSNTPG
jgi:hypothetical protein